MPKKIHFIFAAVLFALIGNQTTSVEAQHLRSRQPFQAGFRWLGQGWSAGYHHQNPGPNSDYYNPYTAHNSMLVSRMPQYQTGHHQYGNHSILPHSSFPNHSGSSWDQGPGQSIQPTFVPVDDEADNENDFKPADPPSVTADSEEPGSIHVDEDLDEDAGFEESSFGDQDAFDDIEAESFGSESKSSGSDTKSSGSESKSSGSDTKSSGSESKSSGSDTKSSGSESKSSGSDTKSSGSESKPSGSGTKSSIPESKPSGSHTKPSGSGSGSKASGSKTKASKTGFSREEPGSLKSLDFESFMVN